MFRLCLRSLTAVVGAKFLLAAISTSYAADTVKVFVLAGQSNMEGKAANTLLDHQATDSKTKDPQRV